MVVHVPDRRGLFGGRRVGPNRWRLAACPPACDVDTRRRLFSTSGRCRALFQISKGTPQMISILDSDSLASVLKPVRKLREVMASADLARIAAPDRWLRVITTKKS
jgi:hypothetical protein